MTNCKRVLEKKEGGGRRGVGKKKGVGRELKGVSGGERWERRRVLAGLTEVHSSSMLEQTENWH